MDRSPVVFKTIEKKRLLLIHRPTRILLVPFSENSNGDKMGIFKFILKTLNYCGQIKKYQQLLFLTKEELYLTAFRNLFMNYFYHLLLQC